MGWFRENSLKLKENRISFLLSNVTEQEIQNNASGYATTSELLINRLGYMSHPTANASPYIAETNRCKIGVSIKGHLVSGT